MYIMQFWKLYGGTCHLLGVPRFAIDCKQFISSKRSEKKFTKHPKCKKKESEKVDWERRGPWVNRFQKESKPTWLCFRILLITHFSYYPFLLCVSFVKWIHDLLRFVSFSVYERLKFQVKRPGLLKPYSIYIYLN